MMKSGSPRGMVGGKMRRPGKASRNPEEVASCTGWRGPLKWSRVESGLGGLLHLISVMPDWIGFKHNRMIANATPDQYKLPFRYMFVMPLCCGTVSYTGASLSVLSYLPNHKACDQLFFVSLISSHLCRWMKLSRRNDMHHHKQTKATIWERVLSCAVLH